MSRRGVNETQNIRVGLSVEVNKVLSVVTEDTAQCKGLPEKHTGLVHWEGHRERGNTSILPEVYTFVDAFVLQGFS